MKEKNKAKKSHCNCSPLPHVLVKLQLFHLVKFKGNTAQF